MKKTRRLVTVKFSYQLVNLLDKFGWNNFFDKELYCRSNKYIGFPAYALRRGLISQASFYFQLQE